MQDDWQIQIVVVAIFLTMFEARRMSNSLSKRRFCFFLDDHIGPPPITLTIEPKLVSKHVDQSLLITPILNSTPILKQEVTTFVIRNCEPDETMHDPVKRPKLELFVELEVPSIGHIPYSGV